MSFSQSVKEEILKNIKKVKGCCATSFLTAVLKSIGSLCVDSNGYCFSVETDNGALLSLCSQLALSEFACETAIYQLKSPSDNSEKNVKYIGKFDLELGKKLNLVYFEDGAININNDIPLTLKNACCKRAFMQALFLSCGSVNIPLGNDDFESKHSNYHLELRFTNDAFAKFVLDNFSELDLKITQRKNNPVLYLKDSEKIADYFVFVDAVNAKFTLENVLIGRSFRNTANRQSNCIDANIEKAVLAGSKQLAAIQKIRQSGKFNMMPQQLKDVAIAREQNREANLAELAAILNISKSGVNHRLAKLLELAEDL